MDVVVFIWWVCIYFQTHLHREVARCSLSKRTVNVLNFMWMNRKKSLQNISLRLLIKLAYVTNCKNEFEWLLLIVEVSLWHHCLTRNPPQVTLNWKQQLIIGFYFYHLISIVIQGVKWKLRATQSINFSTFSHRPVAGDKIGVFLANTRGITDLEHLVNLKWFNMMASPILACIIPKRSPIQTRGPSPNGKNVREFLLPNSSGENLSGSYTSGFG